MSKQVEAPIDYEEVRAEEEFDPARLQAYLRGKLAGADRPMQVKQFRGGHSNLTYLLRFDGQEWVLRRPPFGPLPTGGHDMTREYKVLSRLWRGFAPAPRAVLLCEDSSVMGAPFFVMERRKGILMKMRQPLPPELGEDPQKFKKISEGFIDALADLHAVDYQAVGLADLGRPEGFLKRQLTGWMARWEKAKTHEVPLMEKLGQWFLDHMPEPHPPTVLHNDFYLHNLMLDAADPGRVTGVFDWEMSTLGDPLIDVGIALGYWHDRTDAPEFLAIEQGHAHTVKPGFLSRDELAERYARRTGRDLSQIAYYRAWAHWRNATVVQQIYVRYVRGQTSDPRFALMSGNPPVLAETAAIRAAADRRS